MIRISLKSPLLAKNARNGAPSAFVSEEVGHPPGRLGANRVLPKKYLCMMNQSGQPRAKFDLCFDRSKIWSYRQFGSVNLSYTAGIFSGGWYRTTGSIGCGYLKPMSWATPCVPVPPPLDPTRGIVK